MQLKLHMITIEDLVPKEHLLRRLDVTLDLSFVYGEVESLDSWKYGRLVENCRFFVVAMKSLFPKSVVVQGVFNYSVGIRSPNMAFHSFSRKRTSTKSSPIRMSRLISILSEASRESCSPSLINGSLSFSVSSLYFRPLKLKKFFCGRPLRLYQTFSSSMMDASFLIYLVVKTVPFPSSHFVLSGK